MELRARKVNLVSIKDGIDLGTPAGRVLAGQAAARAEGKVWGGRKAGTRIRLTTEKERTIRAMHCAGESIAAIARAVELTRTTVYRALEK